MVDKNLVFQADVLVRCNSFQKITFRIQASNHLRLACHRTDTIFSLPVPNCVVSLTPAGSISRLLFSQSGPIYDISPVLLKQHWCYICHTHNHFHQNNKAVTRMDFHVIISLIQDCAKIPLIAMDKVLRHTDTMHLVYS